MRTLLTCLLMLAATPRAQPSLPLIQTLTPDAFPAPLSRIFLIADVPGTLAGDASPDLLVGGVNADRTRTYSYLFDGATLTPDRLLLDGSWLDDHYVRLAIGDVTGDGVADFAAGAPYELDRGRAYVYDGDTGALLWSRLSPRPGLFQDFGFAAAPIGDATGDGRADLVVAEPDEGLHAFDGTDGALLWSALDLPGACIGQEHLLPLGDLTGDGVGDVAVSLAAGSCVANGVAVVSGADGALLHHLVSPQPAAGGSYGGSVTLAGDRDGDGTPDLFVGAVDGAPRDGRLYLYSLATGDTLRTYTRPAEIGPDEQIFGALVFSGADVDGDGVWDIVTRTRLSVSPYTMVYVVSGATGAVLARVQSPNPVPQGNFGGRMVLLGGPGGGRLVVGAAGETVAGVPGAGRIYVYGTVPVAGEDGPTAPGTSPAASLSLSPNPSSGASSVTLTLASAQAVRVAVVDALGRTVAVVHDGPLAAGRHRLALPAALAPGVYAVVGAGATARWVVAR